MSSSELVKLDILINKEAGGCAFLHRALKDSAYEQGQKDVREVKG